MVLQNKKNECLKHNKKHTRNLEYFERAKILHRKTKGNEEHPDLRICVTGMALILTNQ